MHFSLRCSVVVNILLCFFVAVTKLPSLQPWQSSHSVGGCIPRAAKSTQVNATVTTTTTISHGLPVVPVVGVAETFADGLHLAYAEPLWPLGISYETKDRRRTLMLPQDTTRICVDVGAFVSSPSAKKWWQQDPRTFVVAFEPNPIIASFLSRLSHPAFVSQMTGYWPSCGTPSMATERNFFMNCLQQNWRHITEHHNRFVVFPIALGNSSGFTRLYGGLPNRPDTGSLLNFRGEFIRQMQKKSSAASAEAFESASHFFTTAVERLSTVMALLPPVFFWDTLKIDAQGADRTILEGAGPLIGKFACVIGEFNERSYSYPRGKKFNYKEFLFGAGFVGVKHGVFLNTKFRDRLLAGDVLCSASDVVVTAAEISDTFSRQRLSAA